MGQHYIPQYYLNGFTEPLGTSSIWMYEKGSDQILNTTTKSVANENRRWPKATEKYLAEKVEAPANPVLDKIRNHKAVTESDKYILSNYMVVMLKRVPRGLQRTKSNAPKVIEHTFDKLKGDILRLMKEYPANSNILEQRLRELPGLRSKYENEIPMEVWYENLKPEASPRLLTVLPTMTWIFLVSNKGRLFLTNDNPVFFFESLGIGRPESEITFPISSNVALWATWHKGSVEGYHAAKDSIVREINRRTASAATRYVFYSEEAQWVVALINKKNWKLRRLA
jgi:hypothetical protein